MHVHDCRSVLFGSHHKYEEYVSTKTWCGVNIWGCLGTFSTGRYDFAHLEEVL